MYLGIDLDEVCCKFVDGFLSYYNVRHGTSISLPQITKWNWWDIPEIKMSKEDFDKTFEEFTRCRMFQDLDIYPDTKFALCALAEEGHHICYLTSRPKDARRATLKFILHNGLPVDSVIFCDSGDKPHIAKSMGIAVAIDDKPDTIEAYLKIGITGVLMARPHNHEFRAYRFSFKGGLVAKSMKDFYDMITDGRVLIKE